MAAARMALIAAAMIAAMLPADTAAQETPSDPAAVTAYVDTLESLYQEGAAVAGRVFDRYLVVDAFRRGELDQGQLAERFDSRSEALRADIEAHFQRLKRSAKPVLTGDPKQDRDLLRFTLTIANMTDLMRGLMILTEKLRGAALSGDTAAYEHVEADVFDYRSALYSSRYNYLLSLLFDNDGDDPRYGIHRAGSGIAEAGVTTYRILADSLRDDAFDVAAYERAIGGSLRLIEKSLSGAEETLADPSWPDAAPGEGAAARAARRERGLALAERYASGARATAAAIRRDVESLRAAADGAAVLSGPEMRGALYALRLDIDRALAGIVELDPVRREFDRLGRAGEAQ